MNLNTISHNYKKIEPKCRNSKYNCRCHCHDDKNNHLLLLEEKNVNTNLNRNTKLNVIKTETNNNLIKSFVIYKNQIKPLYFSKVVKNPRKNISSNIKKYSYGGNRLKIATNTNNHSYKEIFGRSSSKDKKFQKSRVINYNTEKSVDKKEYNFDYSNNCNKKQNNINVIKDIKINNEKIYKCNNQKKLSIKTDEINYSDKESKYEVFIDNLSNKLKNNYEKEKNSLKIETENNINNKCNFGNLMNKNFRYYYDYKKNMIEKKKNLFNSNSYMNIRNNNLANKIKDDYEEIKLKIKLGLIKKNNELNKNKLDINYILLEKTKKILEEKYKKKEKKMIKNNNNNNKINDKDIEGNILNKLKNSIENNNINKNFFGDKN